METSPPVHDWPHANVGSQVFPTASVPAKKKKKKNLQNLRNRCAASILVAAVPHAPFWTIL